MNVGAISRLVLGGCSVALLVSCGKQEVDRRPNPVERPVRTVQVAKAQTRLMERTIAVSGSLAAQESSVLSAKVPGRLQRLAVDIGSLVRKGDLIAEIEPKDYELRLRQSGAALAQARAAVGLPVDGEEDSVPLEAISVMRQAQAVLNEASKSVERVRALTKEDVASKAELDTAESNYGVASARLEAAREEAHSRMAALAQRRAEYEIARKQLSDARVLAPFDGAVQSRESSLGEYVASGTPIVTLVQSDPLRLRLEVSERESSLVATGQAVRLLAEGSTHQCTGKVVRLSPALEETSRTLLVEAEVPNDGSLRPGLFARALIILSADEPGLAVPSRALVTFAGIEKVLLVSDGKALEKKVATGRRAADWVEITSGIEPGAMVILDAQGIQNGQPVSVEQPAPPSPTSSGGGAGH